MKAGGREKSFGKILVQVLREILRRVISLKRRIWLVCRSQNEGYGGIFQHLFYGFARIAPFGACGNCPFLRHFLFQTVYFPPVFPPLRKERRFFLLYEDSLHPVSVAAVSQAFMYTANGKR